MNKPISMIINDTRISLTDICNNSGLPACILEPIIKDLFEEVRHISALQLKQDEENYAKAQKDAQDANTEETTE